MAISLLLVILLLGQGMVTQAAWPAKGDRLALVIGNADYQFSPLKNPVNDAKAMAAQLENAGFQVILRNDAGYQQLEEAVQAFSARLDADTVGLFYYAGHGVQVNGQNYLVPVDSSPQNQADVKYRSLNINYLMDIMRGAQNRMNIVILDACRNNPFAKKFQLESVGLARMDGPIGSLIAYSTSPGNIAIDGAGNNSIYTKHLLQAMAQPGLTLEQVFRKVRNAVIEDTQGEQTPWEESSLLEAFSFFGNDARDKVHSASQPSNQAGVERANPAGTREQRIWMGIRDSDVAEDFTQFLEMFPDGDFAPYAERRLAKLATDPNRDLPGSSRNIDRRSGPPVIAIADIELTHPSARLVYSAESIQGQVAQQLHHQRRFRIVDLDRFDQALEEEELEWSDLVEDEGNRKAVQNILQNDYYLVVNVLSYSDKITYNSSAFRKHRTQTTTVKVNLQLLHALSNEVIQSVGGVGSKSNVTTKSVVGLGPAKGVNQQLATDVMDLAIADAVGKLSEKS